jgi:hypothetical protein
MSKMLGAAVAAVVLSCAGAASAATHVLTFENYNVGDLINGYVAGTPFPVLRVQGEIVAGPTGNALKIQPLYPPHQSVRAELRSEFTGSYADPENEAGLIYYHPTLLSFDFFAPVVGALTFEHEVQAPTVVALNAGVWGSVAPNYLVTDLTWRMSATVPYLLVDNMAFEDGYAVVPEPATWAMMITGFGLVGSALRRRRQSALDVGCAVIP